ncbi:hypothetical protein Misp03_25640 [Microbispora sp. NBRC 16548]|nr:hypothetical protein Misp03_25640 [Microbispora sp. NBRC 16548]
MSAEASVRSLKPTSVVYPLQPHTVTAMVPYGRLVRDRGGRLWTGQSLRIDTHQLLVSLVERVPGLAVGTGVTLTPLRHPFEAAIHARSVAAISGAPVVAGFGPGAPEFQAAVMREPYRSPLTAMHEYVTIVRRLLDGEMVEHDGEYHTLHGGALYPIDTAPIEVGLGVLRPRMAELAGRVADVAITWMTPSSYIREQIVPAIEAGAKDQGRTPPRIATVVHVAVARPGRDLLGTVRAGAGAHLSGRHYTDMLRRAGLDADVTDPDRGAAALLDSGTFVTGSPEQIVEGLQRYRDCGVDEVVLNPAGVLVTEGPQAALRDVLEILDAEAGRD